MLPLVSLHPAVVKTPLEPFDIPADVPPSDTIAARLRRVLAEKHLTESKAAELAGLARSAVTKVLHKLEAGSESVQLDTLKKIAGGIGVSWTWAAKAAYRASAGAGAERRGDAERGRVGAQRWPRP